MDSQATTSKASLTFTNPILTGFNPDPSIARVGEDFFLTTSTFEYFPGLPIYHSQDLLNWKLIGHALTRRSQLDLRTVEPGAGIWAPTLRWRADVGGKNGRFYLATCSWSRYRSKTDERIFPRGFYVYTDDIWDDSAWSEPIYFDNPGFDQDLFWDDDGKVYLSTTMRMAQRPVNSRQKDFAIHISEIDLESGTTLTAPQVIRASPHGIAEGSHIIKRGRYYYLFTAEGGTEAGHQEWVLRSESGPLGPWLLGPRNPLWYNAPGEEVQSTGHADIFEDAQGYWWAVLLGTRPPDRTLPQTQLGRESYLVKVEWEDDWPVFNGGQNIAFRTIGHVPKVQAFEPPSWKANFELPDLELGWYTKHTPLKKCYTISASALHIHGNCHVLSSPESPAMLLRKQRSFSEVFEARLRFSPSRKRYEAGIVLWWSMYSYVSIGLCMTESGALSLAITQPGKKDAGKVYSEALNERSIADGIRLRITASASRYTFSVPSHEGAGAEKEVFSVAMVDVVRDPEVGGSFAGMMWGLYAFGNGEPCLDAAAFSDVSIRNLL